MSREIPQSRDGQPHQAEHGNLNCDLLRVVYETGDVVDEPLIVPGRYVGENTILSIVAAVDAITGGSSVSVGYRDLETGTDYPTFFADNVALVAGQKELLVGKAKAMRLQEGLAISFQIIITPKGGLTVGESYELHVYRKHHGSN